MDNDATNPGPPLMITEQRRGIEAKCESCGSSQKLYTPDHEQVAAVLLAGLMDGTSPVYAIPPPRDGTSLIGKCQSCEKGVFRCLLFGYGE